MATFVEIRTRVLRRLIDAPASVTSEVPDLVNEAMVEIQERHNFKVMETETAPLVTVALTRDLAAVPANWKEHRGKPYMVRNDGTTKPLVLAVDRAAVLTAFPLSDTNDTGEPQVVLADEPTDAGAYNFEVYPFSDGNSDWSGGEYRIVIPYYRFLPALSGDNDTNWFTVEALKYLVNKATAEGFFLDWDEQRGTLWETRAEGEYVKARRRDKRLRLSGMTTLVPHKDVNAITLEY